jgi:hypothetical protein
MTNERKTEILNNIKAIGLNFDIIKDTTPTVSEIKTFDTSIPKTVVELFGIEQTKDVAKVLCLTVNNFVNGDSFLSLDFAKAAFEAGNDIKQVPNELLNLSEKEVTELYEFIVVNLKFNNSEQYKVERLAEKILLGVLTIVAGLVEYTAQ